MFNLVRSNRLRRGHKNVTPKKAAISAVQKVARSRPRGALIQFETQVSPAICHFRKSAFGAL